MTASVSNNGLCVLMGKCNRYVLSTDEVLDHCRIVIKQVQGSLPSSIGAWQGLMWGCLRAEEQVYGVSTFKGFCFYRDLFTCAC